MKTIKIGLCLLVSVGLSVSVYANNFSISKFNGNARAVIDSWNVAGEIAKPFEFVDNLTDTQADTDQLIAEMKADKKNSVAILERKYGAAALEREKSVASSYRRKYVIYTYIEPELLAFDPALFFSNDARVEYEKSTRSGLSLWHSARSKLQQKIARVNQQLKIMSARRDHNRIMQSFYEDEVPVVMSIVGSPGAIDVWTRSSQAQTAYSDWNSGANAAVQLLSRMKRDLNTINGNIDTLTSFLPKKKLSLESVLNATKKEERSIQSISESTDNNARQTSNNIRSLQANQARLDKERDAKIASASASASASVQNTPSGGIPKICRPFTCPSNSTSRSCYLMVKKAKESRKRDSDNCPIYN